MNRLKYQPKITYDANIIVYYCFSTEFFKITELTERTHKLTEFLIKNNSKIIIPSFIVNELNKVTFSKIVSDYLSNNEVTNLPKNHSFLFKIQLEGKIRKKFNSFLKKDWVFVENFVPNYNLIDGIINFFNMLEIHSKSQKFLNLKKRDTFKPSKEDINLIAFSKEIGSVLISNDYDLTFFADELYEKKLSGKIFSIRELNIFNN